MRLTQWLFRDILGRLDRLEERLLITEEDLADLTSAEAQTETSVKNLEDRDIAHQQALKDINTSLQAIIDANKTGGLDVAGVTAKLQALSASIDAFDPDAPAPIAPVVGS